MARLSGRPKRWDRFSKWAPGAAMMVLLSTLALLAAAVLTAIDLTDNAAPGQQSEASATTGPPAGQGEPATTGRVRDADLQLYARIAQRVGAGDGYYQAAIEEHRAGGFPLRPGLEVRLPTLAMVSGWLGPWGMGALAAVLALLTLIAWWRKLDDEPGGREYRPFVLLLLVVGVAAGLRAQYLLVHEVWAGLLIALSFGLYRPGKWVGAVLVAALALAVREHALPYVLLMGALALVRGRRGEAVAWVALVTLFGIGLIIHLVQVALLTDPNDLLAPSWLAMRGLGGWTANIALASSLYLLPIWLAAPITVLPLLGWAGWRSETGLAGFLLCLGYGLAFTIAGRDSNFYWALVMTPLWFIGLAFVPRSLASLWNSARDY